MGSKMDREDRAKQFMPFAALKGYPEALRKEEVVLVSQAELSEEYQEELDRKLHQIQRGDVITVEYYRYGSYYKLTGEVKRIDKTERILFLEDTKIPFDRLRCISNFH